MKDEEPKHEQWCAFIESRNGLNVLNIGQYNEYEKKFIVNGFKYVDGYRWLAVPIGLLEVMKPYQIKPILVFFLEIINYN